MKSFEMISNLILMHKAMLFMGWGDDFNVMQIDGTFIEQVFQDSIYNYFPKYEHQ